MSTSFNISLIRRTHHGFEADTKGTHDVVNINATIGLHKLRGSSVASRWRIVHTPTSLKHIILEGTFMCHSSCYSLSIDGSDYLAQLLDLLPLLDFNEYANSRN